MFGDSYLELLLVLFIFSLTPLFGWLLSELIDWLEFLWLLKHLGEEEDDE